MKRINGHEVQNYIRGVQINSLKRFKTKNVGPLLEKQANAMFLQFFSDRRATYRLLVEIRKWVEENCIDLMEETPILKVEVPLERFVNSVAGSLLGETCKEQFGNDRFIAAHNKIGADRAVREEFRLDGAEASQKNFSYVLDGV